MANFANSYLGHRGVDDCAEQAAHTPPDQRAISSERRFLQAWQDRRQAAFDVELVHGHASTSGGLHSIGCPGVLRGLARMACSIAESCSSMPALTTANGV